MNKNDTLEQFMCKELKASSEKPTISTIKGHPDVLEDFQVNTKNHVLYPRVKEVVINYYVSKDFKIDEAQVYWIDKLNLIAFDAEKEGQLLLIAITRMENFNTMRVTVGLV